MGVLSYRNMEIFCMIEPLRRAARTARLLLRILGGNPPLVVNQELHCPNSTRPSGACGVRPVSPLCSVPNRIA